MGFTYVDKHSYRRNVRSICRYIVHTFVYLYLYEICEGVSRDESKCHVADDRHRTTSVHIFGAAIFFFCIPQQVHIKQFDCKSFGFFSEYKKNTIYCCCFRSVLLLFFSFHFLVDHTHTFLPMYSNCLLVPAFLSSVYNCLWMKPHEGGSSKGEEETLFLLHFREELQKTIYWRL